MNLGPLVLVPDPARHFRIGKGEARILLGAGETGGACWLGEFTDEPGRRSTLHVHDAAEEYFHAQEGVLSMWIDGGWRDLAPGAVAVVPRGVPHALANRTSCAIRFQIAGTPAGFERFFADIHELSSRFPESNAEYYAELAKVYTKYDSRMLAPPPGD